MFDKFSDRHIGVTNPEDLKAMLAVIGVKSVDELIAQVIPQSIRLKQPLALPQGMSEYEFANHIQALAAKNRTLRSFIGMGYYPCAVPAAITRNVFENPAWYTSYTPYQARDFAGTPRGAAEFPDRRHFADRHGDRQLFAVGRRHRSRRSDADDVLAPLARSGQGGTQPAFRRS